MITIVTGTPRTGTSMTMMMLDGGGIKAVYDPTIHHNINRYGSFELSKQVDDLTIFDGQCVKIMSPQTLALTPVGKYKLIMPVRDPMETILSRREAFKSKNITDDLVQMQVEHLKRQYDFLKLVIKQRPDMELLEIPYEDYFSKTEEVAEKMATFLGGTFDTKKAAAAVDQTLLKIRVEK